MPQRTTHFDGVVRSVPTTVPSNSARIQALNAVSKLQWFYDDAGNLTREHQHYLMTGDPDYLLRVLLPSIQALELFLDYLTRLPGVANIRSSFALKQVRYKTALPLPSNGMTLRE